MIFTRNTEIEETSPKIHCKFLKFSIFMFFYFFSFFFKRFSCSGTSRNSFQILSHEREQYSTHTFNNKRDLYRHLNSTSDKANGYCSILL